MLRALVAVVALVAAGWLFRSAPEGVNSRSVGSLALLAAALVNVFRAGGASFREEAEPLAKALGLRAEGGYGLFSDAHCYLRGEREGRAVEIRVDSTAGGRGDQHAYYRLSGGVPARSDLTIKLLPVLEQAWDRYLEHLPPELPGLWPRAYKAYGEPEDRARYALSRLQTDTLARLSPPDGRPKDAIRLAHGRCRFETGSRDRLPTPQHARFLLELCEALARSAETA